MQLEGTVAIVTGASGGLGQAMARGLVDDGATVVCAARSSERLDDVVDDLSDRGTASTVPTDVRSWDDVQSLVTEAVDRHGGVDVLINNAGVSERGLCEGDEPSVDDMPVDVWKTILETNLTGAFLCAKAVVPVMKESGTGRLIHVSSEMGRSGRAGRSAYVASKFGLEGLHESLTDELDGTDVDSLVLDPGGGVDTEGFSGYMSPAERAERLDPSVMVRPAVELAAGAGTHGGRYVATEWS